jgi:peptide/nickel transport system substrate-binding protein
MKKQLLVLAVLVLLGALLLGCSSTSTSTPAATSPASSSTGPAQTTSTSPSAETPILGGTLRIIGSSGPQVLSYYPNMVVTDENQVFAGVDRLVDGRMGADGKPEYYPRLAQSYNIDPVAKTMTFNLRKGAKFTDGSDVTADVVAWNFQLYKDKGRLQQSDNITSFVVKDPYTFVINFKTYNNESDFNWGWVPIFSKAAWDAAGTTDDARIKWATDHLVSVGPFSLSEFVRDDHVTWVKNPNYYIAGKPYLDKIIYTYIPDPVSAAAVMEKGDADIWNAGSITDYLPLMAKGLVKVQSWPMLTQDIVPNTTNPNSKWQNKNLRDALEYSIDKKALAQALGKGYYPVLKTMAPPGSWGDDPNYVGKSYDVAKAKQLLTAAGYPNGLKVTLMIGNDPASQDAGTLLKGYMDAAGFQTTLDIADPGRYFGAMFGTGWDDLIYSFAACAVHQDEDYMAWFGYAPRSNLASFKRDYPEKTALEHQIEQVTDQATRIKMTQQLYNYLEDNTLVVPLFGVPGMQLQQPWVRGNTFLQGGFPAWPMENLWLAKH